MSIQGLWEIQTDAIVDIRFGDADAETWKTEGMDKLFPRWEVFNKDKHRKHFHNQQKKYPFVLLVDGMMVKEVQVVLATFSQLMAAKIDEPISQIKGWVNGRIEIGFTRSYSRLICID